MITVDPHGPNDPQPRRRIWILRGVLVLFVLCAGAIIWVSNTYLTQRFTETTRNRAELRLAIYSGSLQS